MQTRLTPEIAEQAFELADPLIRNFLRTELASRPDFHAILAMQLSDGAPTIVARRSYGNRSQWELPFDQIADGKIVITARTGLSSREVQLMRKDLLVDGDVIYWGSWIENGTIGGGSGQRPWFDEMVGKILVAICKALMENEVEAKAEAAKAAKTVTYDQRI